jgi:glycosyltransferase involved in cell wall biosynthesis
LVEKERKLKVIWVCSFANEEIANVLKVTSSFTASPWITDLIKLFRNQDNIDLTIISPNYYTNTNETICLDKIQVYLFKYRPSFIPDRAYNFNFNFSLTKRFISKKISEIEPDIIHLHGSENPFYGAGVLPLIDKYPTLVTIQGYVSQSSMPKNPLKRFVRWNRVRFEKLINKKANYFSVGSENSLETLRKLNSHAKIHEAYYPTTVPNYTSDDCIVKKYDIVYYAKISKNKGIEDLLHAIKILKESNPAIKVIIIGGGNTNYIEFIKNLIIKLNLEESISFAGFQKTQQDVFKLAIQAKVYVLPTHFDALPGSLREAMFLRIPVVANAVGGIPSLNSNNKCITLVEKGDISQLAEKIKLVLQDKKRSIKLVDNAYNLITSKFSNQKIISNFISIYNKILIAENTDV